VSDAAQLGNDLARAFQIATTPRPGPVHLSLPFDLLETVVEQRADSVPPTGEFQPTAGQVDDGAIEKLCDQLCEAKRPLILAGPAMMRSRALEGLCSFAKTAGLPVIGMESPRGVNDPSLGAFAEILPQADAIVLLGKKLDFTLWLDGKPAPSSDCRLIQFDPDEDVLELTRRIVDDRSRLISCDVADPIVVAEKFMESAAKTDWTASDWCEEVQSAIAYRPADWPMIKNPDGPMHAVEVCRAVQDLLSDDDQAVLISDGGEFGQWAQACVHAPHRIINGPSGAIGSAIPFALAARLAFPDSRVVTMLGDGTFGFHPAEFDTAVRYGLPFIAVVAGPIPDSS